MVVFWRDLLVTFVKDEYPANRHKICIYCAVIQFMMRWVTFWAWTKQRWDASFFLCVQQEMKSFSLKIWDKVNSKCYQVLAEAKWPHLVRGWQLSEIVCLSSRSYFSFVCVSGCMPSSIQWCVDHPEGKHHSEAVTDRTWRFYQNLAIYLTACQNTLSTPKMVYKQYNTKIWVNPTWHPAGRQDHQTCSRCHPECYLLISLCKHCDQKKKRKNMNKI